jgi:hypothetical protein
LGLSVAIIFPALNDRIEVSAIPLADAGGGWREERDAPALLRMERRSWVLMVYVHGFLIDSRLLIQQIKWQEQPLEKIFRVAPTT